MLEAIFVNFYERLNQLCKNNDTTVSSMLKELGLSTGSTGNWKKGQLPKGDILVMIADYLNTSIDYIVNGEYKYDLSDDELQVLEVYKSVPERAKYKVLCDLENIAAAEKAKLSHSGTAVSSNNG